MSRVRWCLLLALLAACGRGPQPVSSSTSIPAAAAPAQAATPAATVPDRSAASGSLEAVNSEADLPPLPFVPFPVARPMPVVRGIFTFAAKHPEVLGHIPCFCGCQDRGHRNNDDCFVSARDERGRVTAWEAHGLG